LFSGKNNPIFDRCYALQLQAITQIQNNHFFNDFSGVGAALNIAVVSLS
jgi:hypothetical protein